MKKCIYYQSFLTLLFLLFGLSVSAQKILQNHPATGPSPHPTATPGFNFIQNKGQWTSEAKYKVEFPGGVMFLTNGAFVYNYISPEDLKMISDDDHDEHGSNGKNHAGKKNEENITLHFHAYKVNFVGANTNTKFVEEEKQATYNNYFIGNDKSKWAGHCELFKKITQQNVYNGIDLSTYSKDKTIKYDFIVAPNADPNQIKLSFEGVKPTIAEDGSLKIKTSINEVKELAPYTYQMINGTKTEVPSHYKLTNNVLTFEFPQGYNKNEPLIIDPVLVFATFSGGSTGTGFYAYGSTYDELGNMYASSGAYNLGWPTTLNAFQATFNGLRDASINKYNASGSSLIYSTYFGGSGTDFPHAMKVNALGELVLVGSTNSTDLPITSGCYDNSLGGISDMYVAHFNLDGTNLIGSTYIGGAGIEPTAFDQFGQQAITNNNSYVASPVELTFDDTGTIWVVGNTTSTDFPVVANNSQNTYTRNKWICQGSTFTFGTQILSATGTYTQIFPTLSGCDSVVKLNLTVGSQMAQNITKNICPGQTYTFGAQVLNTTGVYNHTFISTTGCDSAVTLNLNVLPFKTAIVSKSICPGTTYSFGGNTLTTAGTYIDTFSTATCDSIVTLSLSFKPYISNTVSQTVCAGKTYTFGTTVLNTAGTYVDTFSTLGCDSIVTLNLSMSPYVRDTVQGTFCSGHSYIFGTHTYTTAGTYVDTFTSQASCDKIVTLQLTQSTAAQYHYYRSICQGGSYQFGTQTLTTPGTYTHTFTTASCDSTVTIHLEYRPNITNAVTAYMCPNGTYTFGTQTLTAAGTYTHTFPTAGCDSVVTLSLNIKPVTNDTISKNICQGTSFVFGPDTFLAAGTYTHTFTSALGCDSTVTVHLTFDPYITNYISDSVCFGGTYTFGNQQLTAAGTYINVYPTSGCDSVVTLTLSTIQVDTFTYTENYCTGSNYYIGGTPVTSIGTYINTYQAASGCDSVVRLILTGPWHHSDSLSGGVDVVLFRLNPTCTQLMYGGYLGGVGDDSPTGLIVNNAGNLVISGLTKSSDFPVTAGTIHPTQLGGTMDGFVSIVNPHYGNMAASTYLGTNANDQATHVQVDNQDNVYVLGRTDGSYPISPGVWTGAIDGDLFIDELTPQLTYSVQSTRLGNSNSGFSRYFPSAFLVDICRNVYVAGYNADGNQPLSTNAQQTTPQPFWFGVLEPGMTGLLYGSYFGQPGDHAHCGISRMDPNGIVYHSICNNTQTYPGTTVNSWAQNNLVWPGGQDIVSFKFNFEATGVHSNFELAPGQNDTGCAPFSVSFHNTSNSATGYEWDFGDGSPISTVTDPTHIYTDTGTFKISLRALNPNTCITNDTSYYTVTVVRAVMPNITVHDTVLCEFTSNIDLHVTVNNPTNNNTFKWGPATGVVSGGNTATATVNPTLNSIYYVTVKDTIPGICGYSASDTVHIDLAPRVLHIITPDTAVCEGAIIHIEAEGTPAYNYTWSPAEGVSDTTILQPNITVNQSNIYTITGKYYACPDTTVTLKIEMQAYPHLTVSQDKAVCQWTDVILESSVTPYRNDYIYQWTPATPNLTNPNDASTHFIADTTIVYHLNIKTPIGCSDDDSVKVTVFPGAFGSIVPDTGYCPGNGNEASLWANGGVHYSWSPADGLSDPNIANPIASPSTTTQYVVLITDVHNCLDTEKVTVSVYPEAILNMPDSINVYPGEQYHLEPGTNALYFTWFPPSGIDNTSSSNPLLSPTVRTRYFVTAKTESGCQIKDSIDVIVKETVIDMPNAFAPNGGNNVFKPSKRGIATLKEFSVYNRWGNKVYTTTNIDQGWDGTYNGKEQPMGVFIYVIEAVTDSGRVFTQKGDVTLIR